MEGSAAGLAAASGGEAGEQAPAQAEGQQAAAGAGEQQANGQQPQGDAAILQMAETLKGMAGSQEEMRQFLAGQAEAQLAQQQQQQEPATPVTDLSFLDEAAPGYDAEKVGERFDQAMKSAAAAEAERLVQEKLSPLQEKVTEMQRTAETDELVREFPELGEAEAAKGAVATAAQLAELVGSPELASNVQFIRLAYINGRAMTMAQEQQAAAGAPGAATLEGAGGASPGGAAQGDKAAADAIGAKWAGQTDVLSRL